MTDTRLKSRPHPWHALSPGKNPPSELTVFVEITPFDHVKYEVDKASGYLKVDRPLYTSSLPPTVYGFVPRTLSGDRVGELMEGASRGDDDPLDVCVISSHLIDRSGVMLSAIVVGGIPMLDGGEADDKIIAVLKDDAVHGEARDIHDIPPLLVEQLAHYFSTYKRIKSPATSVEVGTFYDCKHACQVVEASMADYADKFHDAHEHGEFP